ncbi:MAG: hypothetical protein QOD32_2202 [Pyrinomonadaceae bacterium]|jgi:hypothetical protein|nr:hypothetical protein [Pyrinomonadaceae bacterium]
MNCRKCKIEIEERDLRRESLSEAAEAHVSSCAACRVFAEERLALRRLVGGLEKISAPADFDFRMRARLASERAPNAPRAAWFNFSPSAFTWPLVGCLALVISASLYYQQQQPDAHATQTAQTESPSIAMTNDSPQTSVAEATPSIVQTTGSDTSPGIEVASSKISTTSVVPERRRNASPRVAGRAGVERASVQVEESTSTGLLGATPRFASSGATRRNEGALIPVQLDAPEGQLKVLLRDTSGGARTISVDSVSFGSRDVMKRPGATYTKASLSTNQGVW